MSVQLLQGSPEPPQEEEYDDWYIDEPQEPEIPPHEIIPECDLTLPDGLYHLVLAPVSLCALLLLSFLVRRKKLCRSCCWGVPGVLSPLNLLDDSGNRWIPCAVFGLLFSSLCRLLLDPTFLNFFPEIYGAHQALWKIVALFYYPALYYPLLACQNVQGAVGCLVGTILSWLHCAALIWQKVECPQTPQFYRYYSLLSTVPQICCLIVLSVGYPALLLNNLRKPFHSQQKTRRNYYLKYLSSLLRRKPNSSKNFVTSGSQVSHTLFSYLYPPNTDFHLSLPSVLAITVSVFSAYQVALLLLVIFLPTVQKIRGAINAEFILMLAGFGLTVDDDKSRAVEYIVYYIWVVEVCYIAALVLSCVMTIVMLLRSLVKHRWAMQSLCTGQSSLVFLQSRSLSPTSWILSSWMSHISYQAAFTCLGLILQHALLFLVHLYVTFLIIIPIVYGKFQITLHILENTWPFWLLLFLVTVMQYLFSRFLFLRGQPAQIHNRRCLFLLTYLLLLVNFLRGGLVSLARLVVSIVFNVIHFCRLDLSLLQHSVQSWDPGYRNYCNFLLLEVSECHPLVQAFCLLLKPQKGKQPDLEEGIHLMPSDGRYQKGGRSQLARARWSLAYTLINNPSLLSQRVSTCSNGATFLRPT
ncbi:receptor for retinol uptake STRA6 [Spea bombifrons]|uniref:receptor for retinol uptake STRA6 n=1 Tax=Spea bombifrons TaxID=233779 RepID=UPI002348F7C8|nr:receptor for retinol uptake STRA6 [Spea bombifrons]XP_053320286.1 receptor for retinol uptake STRA6 [Spea bombifrons]